MHLALLCSKPGGLHPEFLGYFLGILQDGGTHTLGSHSRCLETPTHFVPIFARLKAT